MRALLSKSRKKSSMLPKLFKLHFKVIKLQSNNCTKLIRWRINYLYLYQAQLQASLQALQASIVQCMLIAKLADKNQS